MATNVFKVGDIITGIKGNGYGWTNHKMTKAKVLGVFKNSLGHHLMVVKAFEHEDKFYVGMTAIVSNDTTKFKFVGAEYITIYREGMSVIALDRATGNMGVARCNPTDTFDFNTGAKLAFDRLMSELDAHNTTATKVIKCDEYKVGDKVKIREDLSDFHTKAPYVVTPMLKQCGKVCEITRVYEYGLYDLKEDDFTWSVEMFEGKVVPIDYEEPKKQPKFKKGDLVEIVTDTTGLPKGFRGVVAFVSNDTYQGILIDFKVDFYNLHDGGGRLPSNSGWWVDEDCIKKVE